MVIFSIHAFMFSFGLVVLVAFLSVISCVFAYAANAYFSEYNHVHSSHSESIKFAHCQLESGDFTIFGLHFVPPAVWTFAKKTHSFICLLGL